MRLEYPLQPQGWSAKIDRSVSELVSGSLARASIVEEGQPLGMSNLIPVYTFSLNDILSGKPLDEATLLVWRSFVFHGEVPVAAVDTEPIGRQRLGEVVATRRGGEILSNTVTAIQRAEAADVPNSVPSDVRLLLVESVHIHALWLKARSGGGSWFMPIPPAHRRFEEYHRYPEQEFVALLREISEERKNFKTPL